MNIDNQILYNYLGLDYSNRILNYADQTNKTINSIANNFIEEYKNDFSEKTFILIYSDDIIGLCAYSILKSIQGVLDFKFYCYGKHKFTKKSILKKDFINSFKFKKLKRNTIYISCFNPIYKVKNIKYPFKDLSIQEYYHVMDKFTPSQIEIMKTFYNLDDKIYEAFNDAYFKEFNFFTNQYGETRTKIFSNEYFNSLIQESKHQPIKIVKLQGDESDFKIFDEIINIKNKCFFFINDLTEEKKSFVENNLNVFINPCNIVNNYNLNNYILIKDFINYYSYDFIGNWTQDEKNKILS